MRTSSGAAVGTGPARKDDFPHQRFCIAAPDPTHRLKAWATRIGGLVAVAVVGLAAATQSVAVDVAAFNRDVKPVLEDNCSGCHNSIVMSGGANLLPYTDPATLQTDRDMWEKIARRVQSGGMPPKDAPRPSQDKLDAMVNFIQAYFDRVDARR